MEAYISRDKNMKHQEHEAWCPNEETLQRHIPAANDSPQENHAGHGRHVVQSNETGAISDASA